MKERSVLIRYEEKSRRWWIYRGMERFERAEELACDQSFASLEEAGSAARALLELPGAETVEAMMRASTCHAPTERI